MRFGITFGLTHDGKVEVVDGPGAPDALNKNFKKEAIKKENPDYAELHFHELSLSTGRKRATFVKPKPKNSKKDAGSDS